MPEHVASGVKGNETLTPTIGRIRETLVPHCSHVQLLAQNDLINKQRNAVRKRRVGDLTASSHTLSRRKARMTSVQRTQSAQLLGGASWAPTTPACGHDVRARPPASTRTQRRLCAHHQGARRAPTSRPPTRSPPSAPGSKGPRHRSCVYP